VNKPITPGRLLCILTALNLLNYLDRYVLTAVRTPLAAEFGVGYGDSGRLFTAFMLGYFLTSPVFGLLGDRSSRKVLIASGIFLWSLGTIMSGLAHGFGALLFWRALVGVGEASYATISPSLLSDAFPADKRNNALTVFYAAIPVGSALGFLLGGEASAHWGWRGAFFAAGAPGLLLALSLLPFREPRRGESDPSSANGTPASPLSLLRNGPYQSVVWGYVAYTFALGAFAFWGPTFLEKVHGFSVAAADRFFGAVIVLGGLGGTLLGGFAASAWRKRHPAGYARMLALSMLLGAPVSLMALTARDPWNAKALLAAAIFLLFLCAGPVNTLILESVPPSLRSTAMAVSIFLIHLFGDMPSPEIVGRLADRSGGDLGRAVLILPAAAFAAALLWLIPALKKPAAPRFL
jgi:predicted MFS family arabinose efflux permease